MGSGFYKFNAVSTSAPVLGLEPPLKTPLEHYSQLLLVSGPPPPIYAAMQVLAYCLPSNVSLAATDLLLTLTHSLWGGACTPAAKSFPGDVAPAVEMAGAQGITKVVHTCGFCQTNEVPDLVFWWRA